VTVRVCFDPLERRVSGRGHQNAPTYVASRIANYGHCLYDAGATGRQSDTGTEATDGDERIGRRI
jgi:hypothetical protein